MTATRELAGLELPPTTVRAAADATSRAPRRPIRIAVRGRAGTGRRALLAARAARAHRPLGVLEAHRGGVGERPVGQPRGQLPGAAPRRVRGHRDPDDQLRHRGRRRVSPPDVVPADVPVPDEELREQLWRAPIPSQVPRAGAFEFAGLARRFQLSGGYIRNAALRAAFLAAEQRTPLTQDHLERAVRLEFRELGKLGDGGILE